ncbi:MAG: hypothetical protein JST42_13130, partial [Bacteroidetes bacterium]|nr:hypothetical protein [Bacteroidota bacterium]
MSENDYIGQLRKKYLEYLRRIIAGEDFAPITLRGGLKTPENFPALFAAVTSFQQYEKANGRPGWSIVWREIKKFGGQRWPSSITVTTEDDYLFLIGKKEEAGF